MYKLVVLTDRETAYGFKLAGAEVIEVENQEEANHLLASLLNDDHIGIIAMNEELVAGLDEHLRRKIDRLYRPIVIPIPAERRVEEQSGRAEYLRRLIRRAVGFDVKLGHQG